MSRWEFMVPSSRFFLEITEETGPGRVRSYHASVPALKKGGNKKGANKKGSGKKQAHQDDDEENDIEDDASETIIELPNPDDSNDKMQSKVKRLQQEYDKIRGGAISSEMFNHLLVKAHGGVHVSILEVAQISMKGASKIHINVFDPELAAPTAASIRDANMGLNPAVEGSSIMVTVNKPSKEAREALIKGINQTTERAKNDIRGIRKNALDKFKKLKKQASEDEVKRLSKKVEEYTEKNLATVKKMLAEKTTAIMG